MATTKSTISRYETGKRDYPGGFLAAFAEAIGKAEADLYRLPDEPPKPASIDAMLENKPDAVKQQARAVIEALLRTGT